MAESDPKQLEPDEAVFEKLMATSALQASKTMNKLQWEMDTNRAILRANTLLAQSLALHSHPIPVVTWPVDGKVTMDPSYPQLPAIGPNDVSFTFALSSSEPSSLS